jgi:Mitochondrial biogenesis AIM24
MSYYNKAEPEIVIDVAVDSERISLTAKDEHDIDPMGTGFVWYTPPLANSVTANLGEKKRGNCEWNIAGHDMQILTMTVPPNDRIITEVGSFMFGSKDIDINTELTCCTSAASASEGGNGGCNEGCQRICGGESCVKLLLVNKGPNPGVSSIVHWDRSMTLQILYQPKPFDVLIYFLSHIAVCFYSMLV